MYFVRCVTLTHHSGRHNAQTNHDKWALSANTDNWHTNSRTLNIAHQARYSSTDNCVQHMSHGNVCLFSPYHQSWSYACIIWDAVLIKYWTAIALVQRHVCRYVVWLHSFSKNQNKSVILKQTSQTLTLNLCNGTCTCSINRCPHTSYSIYVYQCHCSVGLFKLYVWLINYSVPTISYCKARLEPPSSAWPATKYECPYKSSL